MRALRKTFIKSTLLSAIVSCTLSSSILATSPLEDAFTRCYKTKAWATNAQGEGSSGTGSTLEATEEYRVFLQDFLKSHKIRSVVDAGCGDWEFSQYIDWRGIQYSGYDIVKSVIIRNKKNFGAPNIKFFQANTLEFDLPQADLLITKDVLQHLPIEDIKSFTRHFSKYKYCLITNDINPYRRTSNIQIVAGQYRPIDLTEPPFNVVGTKILTFETGWGETKQVLLIDNTK